MESDPYFMCTGEVLPGNSSGQFSPCSEQTRKLTLMLHTYIGGVYGLIMYIM